MRELAENVEVKDYKQGLFLPLCIDLLLPKNPFDADIYLKVGKEMVLFRKKKLPLSRRRIRAWREMGVKRVYLYVEDHRLYLDYLQSSLPSVMEDRGRTTAEKARFLYSLSESFFEEMLRDFSEEMVRRGVGLVQQVIEYLRKGPELGKKVLKVLSHDFATYVHLNNVFFLTTSFSLREKLTPGEVRTLALASFFHDVGKGRIPQEILQKPGKLTPAEWKEIKKHPLYSRQALEEANLTDERVLRIVEQHHETSDGQGYPYGLRAGEIDPGARLVQICDIFEALCGIRPYRRPLTPYEALRLMKEEMREKIDWELYRSFVRFLGPDYYRKVLRR
ncbi:MAG: hypothetical protein DRG36_00130 [Deltaproteobacteria bacterium]|nr:MAG: hypothetical protein DRG36_00130 [Deltaproteobacteria bacterium]